jgi:hypothetical protein
LQLKHTLFVQPYEQLANVMRTMGRDEDAKKVLIAKNEREGEFIPLRFNRFGDWMWFKIVGPPVRYGYRPWNALLASFVVIGSFVEFAQLHQQVVAPLQIVFLLCSDQTVKQTH